MKPLLVLVCVLALAGCGRLVIKEEDGFGSTTGKVASRVALCPITLCMSEVVIGVKARNYDRMLAEKKVCEAEGMVYLWRRNSACLTQDGYEKLLAAEAAAGPRFVFGGGGGGGLNGVIMVPPDVTGGRDPIRRFSPPSFQSRQPLNCNSMQNGNFTNTTCF